MPGYGKREYMDPVPEPSDDVKTVERRFKMPSFPKLTLVQFILLGMIIAYAWTVRKINGVVVSSIALSIALLHMYDHLYLVKRGPEHLFFLPKKEAYCGACRK
jgi:hypothetical protein